MSESPQALLNNEAGYTGPIDVEEWRIEQLHKMGIRLIEAKRLARSKADLHVMLDARKAGCKVSLMLRIFRD